MGQAQRRALLRSLAQSRMVHTRHYCRTHTVAVAAGTDDIAAAAEVAAQSSTVAAAGAEGIVAGAVAACNTPSGQT